MAVALNVAQPLGQRRVGLHNDTPLGFEVVLHPSNERPAAGPIESLSDRAVPEELLFPQPTMENLCDLGYDTFQD
jgi:hypothetical protein